MKIVAAAVKVDGLTMSKLPPARHNNILAAMPERMSRKVIPCEQGFLTDDGKFLCREDALAVAREAGQLFERDRRAGTVL